MDRIFIDETLSLHLGSLDHPIHLCSPTGAVVGRFDPLFVPPPEDCCPYAPEELEQMRSEAGGRQLADFWKKLNAQ